MPVLKENFICYDQLDIIEIIPIDHYTRVSKNPDWSWIIMYIHFFRIIN